MPILVGTCGWSYPSGRGRWNGIFYPARRPRGFDELAYYAERFDTVEINSTFYRQPDIATTQRWMARTPASFLFSAKLFQKFTHPDMFLARHRVADWDVTRGDLDVFRAGIDPIASAGRLAALLLQFPPSFRAGEETRAYLDWLAGALAGYPLAVELRHRSWSDESGATRALLSAHRAAWAWIDEPKFEGSIQQPSLVDTDAPIAYMRLHGRNAAHWWQHDDAEDRYDYLYSAEELAPIAETARSAAASGRRVMTYLNNHFSAKAPANAAVLRHQLGDWLPADYPLEMTARYPELKGIVRTAGLPLDE
ncbi:MAG TPA: DUF72 domain-containing protein [Vicinamibacterales bacterium]|jgi:uncharacterized protein YecE (DUF72 family)|nr:DUF72 domain-containing protein [Vicinamibacterales bacterium]